MNKNLGQDPDQNELRTGDVTSEVSGSTAADSGRSEITRIRLAVVVFAVLVFAAGLLFDILLIHLEKISQLHAAAVLDGVFALLLSILLYRVLMYDRERRILILQRLETIDEMNHHIRNALQVISFNAHPQSNEFELVEIKRAMNRIQWAVREILPRMEPEFNSFEGSAREQSKDLKSPER